MQIKKYTKYILLCGLWAFPLFASGDESRELLLKKIEQGSNEIDSEKTTKFEKCVTRVEIEVKANPQLEWNLDFFKEEIGALPRIQYSYRLMLLLPYLRDRNDIARKLAALQLCRDLNINLVPLIEFSEKQWDVNNTTYKNFITALVCRVAELAISEGRSLEDKKVSERFVSPVRKGTIE